MRNYTGHGWEGKNYDDSLSIVEIAKKVRSDLKEKFPECTFSVVKESYAGGCSLTVSLMKAPFEAIITTGNIDPQTNEFKESMSPDKKHAQIHGFFNDYKSERYNVPDGLINGAVLTKDCWEVMKETASIIESYNYDDSDGMIDYFDTNFYLHLNIGKWDRDFVSTGEQEKIEPKKKEKAEPVLPADETNKKDVFDNIFI